MKKTSVTLFATILSVAGGGALHATALLPITSLACTVTTFGGSQACTLFSVVPQDAQIAAQSNGISGVKDYYTGTLQDTETANGAKTTTVAFTTSGTVTGTGEPIGTLIPFAWDFSLVATNATLTGYTVIFDLKNSSSTSVFSSTPTFTNPLSGTTASVSSTGSATTASAIVTPGTYTVSESVAVNWTPGAGSASSVQITLPQTSLDFNAASPVPEAGNLILLGLGLAGISLWGRRRSRV